MRLKMSITLPSYFDNDILSDNLVKDCKQVTISWRDNENAVLSCTNTKKELKKIFEKYDISVNDKDCEDVKQNFSTEFIDGEPVETFEPYTVITSLD